MKTVGLFKKADTALYIFWGLCALALFLISFHNMRQGQGKARLTVMRDNETCGVYDLSEDQTLVLDTGNTFEIKDGEARMVYANCPDQICVHSRAISSVGESIVCLPNHVILKITGEGDGTAPDAISE